ncbi:hypothetical protein N7486_003981 [Penicillium sp. IBT 16267x]|nr:hypothetical protein N7486_003981 [Penicillium sp. IBT 16267x]
MEVIKETPRELMPQNDESLSEPIGINEETPWEPVAQNEEILTEPTELLQYIGDPNIMPSSLSGAQHETSMELVQSTTKDFAGQETQTDDAFPDAALSQYSQGSDEATSPIELEPHPGGTPDYLPPHAREVQDLSYEEPFSSGMLKPPLLTAGFEDPSCIAVMETKTFVARQRRFKDILTIWFQSQKEVIVIYEFESRAYYKFRLGGGLSLRTKLKDLLRESIFAVYNEFGLGTPDINTTYDKAVKTRLILATRRDNPVLRKRGDRVELEVSIEDLKEYFRTYDIHTGKRKVYHDQPAKKRGKMKKAQDEELQEEEEL